MAKCVLRNDLMEFILICSKTVDAVQKSLAQKQKKHENYVENHQKKQLKRIMLATIRIMLVLMESDGDNDANGHE